MSKEKELSELSVEELDAKIAYHLNQQETVVRHSPEYQVQLEAVHNTRQEKIKRINGEKSVEIPAIVDEVPEKAVEIPEIIEEKEAGKE